MTLFTRHPNRSLRSAIAIGAMGGGSLLLVGCTGSGTEPPADLELGVVATAGAEVAGERGCVSCHSSDGNDGSGPSWKGVWGTERSLTAGGTVTVDDEYVRVAIEDPRSEVADGYANIMPTYDDLSAEDIAGLVAYICMLGDDPDPEECEAGGA